MRRVTFTIALLALTALAQADEPVQQIEVLGHYETALGSTEAASEGSVTARLLANRPALRPGELLEYVPGVIVTQHSGDGKANQYFLRGFNLDHGTDFATSIDGMPVNMPSHAHGQGYTDLNFLIPELVQRIDYRKGPYFADEGDFASAGAAHIALKGALPASLAQATLGAHGARRLLLAGSRSIADGQALGALELQANDGPWDVPERLRKWNGWLRWSQDSERSIRSLTLMGYGAHWTATDQIPERAVAAGRTDRFGGLDASDGGRSARFSLSAQTRTALADGDWQANAYLIRSRLNLYSDFTYYLDDPLHGDQFEQAEARTVSGGAASRRWHLTLAGREADATLGLQLRHDEVGPLGLYATEQRRRLATTQESNVQQTMGGAYAQLTVRAAPWLRGTAGLRWDRLVQSVDSSIAANSGHAAAARGSPKLSLVFGPWAHTEFFVDAGRGFHSNDARGAVAHVAPREGTPADPVPPLVGSRGAELGLRTEPRPGWQSSLALWRLDLDSELVFSGDAGDTEAQRASRRSGVEWSNHWRLARSWLFDLDLAASRARFTGDDRDRTGDHVPGAANHVGSLGLTWSGDGRWFGNLELRHFGPRDLDEDGRLRSASTTLASLRAGWHASPSTTLILDVFNLFDRSVNDIDYVYASRLAGEPAGGVVDRHFHPAEGRSAWFTLALRW
jgi:hypothetical protein